MENIVVNLDHRSQNGNERPAEESPRNHDQATPGTNKNSTRSIHSRSTEAYSNALTILSPVIEDEIKSLKRDKLNPLWKSQQAYLDFLSLIRTKASQDRRSSKYEFSNMDIAYVVGQVIASQSRNPRDQDMQDVKAWWTTAKLVKKGMEPQEPKPSNSPPPSKSLWVGNVHDLTESQIRNAFAAFGHIESIKVIPESHCAFVNYEHPNDAKAAFSHLNGYLLGAKPLVLNWRPGQGSDPEAKKLAKKSGSFTESRALWVGNVSTGVEEEDLQRIFGRHGAIEWLRLIKPKHCAFINYYKKEDAVRAMRECQGRELAGSWLKINFGKPVDAELETQHDSRRRTPSKSPPRRSPRRRSRSRSRGRSRSRSRSRKRERSRDRKSRSRSRSRSRARDKNRDTHKTRSRSRERRRRSPSPKRTKKDKTPEKPTTTKRKTPEPNPPPAPPLPPQTTNTEAVVLDMNDPAPDQPQNSNINNDHNNNNTPTPLMISEGDIGNLLRLVRMQSEMSLTPEQTAPSPVSPQQATPLPERRESPVLQSMDIQMDPKPMIEKPTVSTPPAEDQQPKTTIPNSLNHSLTTDKSRIEKISKMAARISERLSSVESLNSAEVVMQALNSSVDSSTLAPHGSDAESSVELHLPSSESSSNLYHSNNNNAVQEQLNELKTEVASIKEMCLRILGFFEQMHRSEMK